MYELVLQLYQESWVQGMEDPDNLARRNMTDQMLHLVCCNVKLSMAIVFLRRFIKYPLK